HIISIGLGVAALGQSAAAQSGFLSFGSGPGEVNVISSQRVSADGETVIGFASAGFAGGPFRWTRETGILPIPGPPGVTNLAAGAISPDGQSVVGGGTDAWVWFASTGESVSVGRPPSGLRVGLSAISNEPVAAGSALIIDRTGSLDDAFLPASWSPDGGLVIAPPVLPNEEQPRWRARQILEDGRLYVMSDDHPHPYLYTPDGGYEELAWGPSGAIDPTGTIIVGSRRIGFNDQGFPVNEAVVWTREGEFILPTAVPGDSAGALLLSDDGRFILGGTTSFVPALWVDREGPIDLIQYATNRGVDLAGWVFLGVTRMSADGRVFTCQVNRFGDPDWPQGRVDIGVLTLEPCPADVNFDGLLLPDDFTEWVARFNTKHIRCDQNGDNACDGSDFFAWVVGYTAGCR
ncbi:MAG: GC-type dockerin domain-anchored protein, partial [Planctomycetota bacterium]